MKQRVSVIGDGGWGTALAMVLHEAGHDVTVWGPFPDYIEQVIAKRENVTYLGGIELPEGITWTADRDAAAQADAIVLAMPTKFYRAVLDSFHGLLPDVPIVSVSKGFDRETGSTMTELAHAVLGRDRVVALSGPSHAEEVARQIPTAVVAASADAALASRVQQMFSTPRFRVYTSDDVLGVQLGGALKNVIAIAVGVSDGLGFGDNTRAALITRGLTEMTRLGTALGATTATFAGLSGMGDLIVTCTSRHSRNRAVGERLGKGETIDGILGSMTQVAEGVWNCDTARELARKTGVEMPIAEQAYWIVREGVSPLEAVQSLMSRDVRPETDH